MKSLTASRLGLAAAAIALLGLVAFAGIPGLSAIAGFLLATAAVVAVGWLLRRSYRVFMWRVGRRLAFSYLLIGVVPIPMLALMGFGALQVAGTIFLGHLYRDTLRTFEADLTLRAKQALGGYLARGTPGEERIGETALGYYRRGERVGGSASLPARWPAWLSEAPASASETTSSIRMLRAARYVLLPDGTVSLALGIEDGESGVMAVYEGEVAAELRNRAGFWIGLHPPAATGEEDDDARRGETRFGIILREDDAEAGSEAPPRKMRVLAPEDNRQRILEFLRAQPVSGWLDRPGVFWRQSFGPLFPLREGERTLPGVGTELRATPRWVIRQMLLDASSESAKLQMFLLLVLTVLLLLLYAAAVLLASLMIWGLSSAVNRMSRATESVQRGDFSIRIPVHRSDQLGALQHSFNTMTANLEGLVKTAAQKEILENELAIARELQQSLLPQNLPQGNGIEFATLFAPSAALGGDYFDILELAGDRLAIVIADVSGHGLSAGLRMAMIKAALLVLMDEQHDPETILRRLDALVRRRAGERFFVTATLAIFARDSGRIELFNAGHPPTYLLRGGGVEEICLSGSPLGALGHHYGRLERALEPGDTLVWLSDGFIEATDVRGEPLGYDGLARALAGPAPSAVEVRTRLLGALERHAGDRPAEDDRSLVILRYEPS